ncbi:MAG TPA: hypothetical protein VFF26_14605 [Gallionella sp.]|nr:hypothetical protein [Gallionella sp.]
MFGIESLDVMIGIITIYLIFALACTAFVEGFSILLDSRGNNLRNALNEMFQGTLDGSGNDFIKAFYAHPKIYSLSKGHKGIPSHIEPSLVSQAVEQVLTNNGKDGLKEAIERLPQTFKKECWFGLKSTTMPSQSKALLSEFYKEACQKTEAAKALVEAHYGAGGIAALKQAIDSQPETIKQKVDEKNEIDVPNPTREMLKALLEDAESEAASFRKLIEEHFDAVMDRASGWYKRHTQIVAFCVSVFLVIGANVDTLKLANALSTNPEARVQMVKLAQEQVNQFQAASAPPAAPTLQAATENLANANADLTSAGIQLGWEETEKIDLNKFFGLLISVLAISLGAPFWFDILSRVMKIRTAGVSPREKA